jgi:hypothetical protein
MIEKQQNNKIIFLDITIQKTGNNMSYNLYCKPTTIDAIIHNTSCHPMQHKMSVINCLINTKHISHGNTHKNTEKYNKVHTTTEPIPNKPIKQKIKQNYAETNQDNAKGNTHQQNR